MQISKHFDLKPNKEAVIWWSPMSLETGEKKSGVTTHEPENGTKLPLKKETAPKHDSI